MKLGEVKLIGAKAVKGGKIQLNFAEIVVNPTKRPNLLGMLNASDDRFNAAKPRQAWSTAGVEEVKAYFGVDCSGLAEGEEMELNIANPAMGGYPIHLEVLETTEASEYDLDTDKEGNLNVLKSAKQYTDKEGVTKYITTEDGSPIFSRITPQLGEVKHTFIGATKEVSSEDFDAIATNFVKSKDAIGAVAKGE